MRHLSREDVLARLEGGSLTASAEHHLRVCARCQEEVASLEVVFRGMREADVPEPSPLFWEHLGSRVREAVALEPEPRRPALWVPGWRWWAPASGLAAAVVALVLASNSPAPLPAELRPAPAPPGLAAASAADEDAQDAWELIVHVAANAEAGESADIWLAPSSADTAATELPAEEQAQLMKVLSEELARSAL
jgi:hypothetical protein